MQSFDTFLESIKTSQNSLLIETFKDAFITCFESLSTDSANNKPLGSVLKYDDVGLTRNDINQDEYFNKTLDDEKLDIVNKSKFGMGRVAKFADPGRSIVSNDPMKNQFTGSQYYAGDAGTTSTSND